MSSESCVSGHQIRAKSPLRPAKWTSEKWIDLLHSRREMHPAEFPPQQGRLMRVHGTTPNLLCLRSGFLLRPTSGFEAKEKLLRSKVIMATS